MTNLSPLLFFYYTLTKSNQPTLHDCADSPCALNATCVDLINDYKCECPTGFSGKRCHIKDNLCSDSPCVHGLCIDKLFSRECLCEPGWSGSNCNQNIDECAASPCHNDAKCIDEINGYKCECSDGYEGVHCQHLVDHCAKTPCHNNATCTNMGPTYHCDCALGFDGVHCEMNVDECSNNQCDKTGTESCRDSVNDFKCVCKPGYTGAFCETKLDQCADSPCLNDAQCVDMGGTFKCVCKSGWTGPKCEQDNGSCAAKPCRNNGFCVSLVGDYFCVCPPGVSGKNCETAPNRCIGEPCHNGGVCGDFGSHLECSCPAPFAGKGCEFKNSGCTENSCKNGGKCVESLSSSSIKKCKCPPGFTGSSCETNIDECATAHCPSGATCVDQINEHICVCPFNLTGVHCDKMINSNYDLQFLDPFRPTTASLYAPFRIESSAISIGLWVKFEKPHQNSAFFTLHQFGNPTKELVKIYSNLIRLSLFDAIPAVEIPLSSSQHLNNGRWNHLMITWQSNTGSYSVIWNSLKTYSSSGYAPGKQLDVQAGITLGSSDLPSFVGSIARVGVWNRVIDFEEELPLMVQHCQRSEEIFKGLLVRFEGFSKIVGRVERTHKSVCGTEQKSSRELHDSKPIQVEDCPSDMVVSSMDRETNVTWQEPVFIGKNEIVKVEKNLKQGQMFTWGDYDVLYIATDNSTNQAQCSFKIRVSKENCVDASDPVNGVQSCESWGPQLKYKACSIECRDGFEFPRSPAVFYTCAADGHWKPNKNPSTMFKYPQCTKHLPATKVVIIQIVYGASPACTESSKEAFTQKVQQTINAIDSKWKMCSLTDSNGCVGTQVHVECGNKRPSDVLRHRRESILASAFGVEIEIPVKRHLLTDPTSGSETSIRDALHNEILSGVLNFEKVLPNGRPDLGSLKIVEQYNCQAGQVVVRDLCVPCAPGTYHSAATGNCEMCPIGEYQPLTARTDCFKCEAEQITASEGAISEGECKDNCPAGHQYDSLTSGCVSCGYGYYQPSSGSFDCIPCGIGKTTMSETATSEDECRDECPDGDQLSASGVCQPCQVGTYRSRGENKKCVACPPGTTTESVSSTRREQCNTPKCKAGQFLVKETKNCQFCPRGTFQNEEQESTCKLCPTDHTTAAPGATAESQCYSTNQCATGEYNCSWHANCIDLPDENDVPSYECRCKPGYRGNGTHCSDACNDFCLNDGICKKNNIGNVECICKENFSGDRCELRFQSKATRITYIVVGIASVVGILIVIVVIVFMISFRFNKIQDNTEKRTDFSELSSSNNVMYGSPPVCEPSRAFGYYYEDDDVYETKSREMIAGGDSERRPTTSSITSMGGAMTRAIEQHKYEQRMRQAQQHMYHPSNNNNDE
uniref:Sushi, von Willebrand factor type A, EGF and pentraxin domain-containing protein 1 n=1 Tax=Caenorhabditis japonica TaxID=281687 RepID=A0A8R1HK39_CAEJA